MQNMKRRGIGSSFNGMEVRRSPRLQAKAQTDSRPLSSNSSGTNHLVSPESQKRFNKTEIVNISDLEKSDQNSSSNTSEELASIGQFIEPVLSPAQADSTIAPSRDVKSEIIGDKAKECNTTRLAGTSAESHLVSENTISSRQVAVEEARVTSDVVEEMSRDINNPKTTDESQRPTYSIGLSGVANMFDVDDTDEDELQSVFDPALVSVQGYRVKEAFAPILRTVMEKYGDIAMNCTVETMENRSLFLEKICDILQTLQTTKFVDIKQTEVKKMHELLVDFGRLNLDIGWLQKRLEEIFEVIELIKHASRFKEIRQRNAQIIKESKKAMESYMSQIQALEELASLEKEKINKAETDDRSIMQRIENLKPKVQRFIKESLLNDLL